MNGFISRLQSINEAADRGGQVVTWADDVMSTTIQVMIQKINELEQRIKELESKETE